MNQDQFRGLWGQLKGKAKIIVGELINDDQRKAEGSVDKLYGRLQRSLGDVKELVKARIDKVRLP
jgi:uncharacterized protein YjbJ (UPF0337 family)